MTAPSFQLDNRFQLPSFNPQTRFRTDSFAGVNPSQFNNGFNSGDLSFNTPQTQNFAGSPITSPGFSERDPSGSFFGGNNVKGPDNSFFGDQTINTGGGDTGGFTGFQGAQLGIRALQTGSGILDAFTRHKNLKLARDAFNFEKEAFNKNFGLSQASFDNQVTTVNNRIGDQNAFKTAQGRTDLSKLVV